MLIVIPTQCDVDMAPNIPTTIEDSMAQAAIQSQFVQYGIGQEVWLHYSIPQERRAEHLFLICGPVSNSVSRALFSSQAVGIPFTFDVSDPDWKILNKYHRPAHPPPQPGVEDYAIL
ncbi:MAG TPA: hypothetical protein VFT91_03345, partial [Dehalococcoidia bacterium]|nr:hypothetical protein [Dehalococcoidia bacterium]